MREKVIHQFKKGEEFIALERVTSSAVLGSSAATYTVSAPQKDTFVLVTTLGVYQIDITPDEGGAD